MGDRLGWGVGNHQVRWSMLLHYRRRRQSSAILRSRSCNRSRRRGLRGIDTMIESE